MVLQTVVGPERGAAVSCREASPGDRISLDGDWDFLHLIEDYRSAPVGWRSIRVPGPWQAQFADLRMRAGTGIYRREVEIPAGIWLRAVGQMSRFRLRYLQRRLQGREPSRSSKEPNQAVAEPRADATADIPERGPQ